MSPNIGRHEQTSQQICDIQTIKGENMNYSHQGIVIHPLPLVVEQTSLASQSLCCSLEIRVLRGAGG